jgi:DNA repair protein RadC
MAREQSTTYRIADLEERQRPRERLAELGAQALNDDELLAILLRVGLEGENAVQVGNRLLRELGGLFGLQRATFAELCQQRGIGEAKAAQIKAAIELGRRLMMVHPDERPIIQSPEDAAALVQYEMSAFAQEHLWVILVDTRHRVIAVDKLYTGSLNASTVRISELFRMAIQRNAAAIIVVHNHPSGDPTPSPEDINLTRALIQAGKLLDIEVLDHLVIGMGRFVSLKRERLGFE